MSQVKRWERKECKPNSLPVLHKMHVKVGDTIKVISGRDKGKIGEISKIFKHNSTIVVKDINLKTKHMKSRGEDQPGQIIKVNLIYILQLFTFTKETPFHCTTSSGFFFLPPIMYVHLIFTSDAFIVVFPD